MKLTHKTTSDQLDQIYSRADHSVQHLVQHAALLSSTAERLWGTSPANIIKAIKEQNSYDLSVSHDSKDDPYDLRTEWDSIEDNKIGSHHSWYGELSKDGVHIASFTSGFINGDYMIACQALIEIAKIMKAEGKI